MWVALLILGIGLTPSLVSVWCLRRSHPMAQARFQQALASVQARRMPRPPVPDQHYVEGMGLVIGNVLCEYNARSPYLRCAINPSGPCDKCKHYQERTLR